MASPFQPRRHFDDAQLGELAASIKSAGMVQPVLVRRASAAAGGGDGYELIAGERRWRASRLAGLTTVPCLVREATDEQAAEWALIENLQRTDLTVMERAHAVLGLVERFGLSQGAVADKLGLERSSVSNLIRLTELEEDVQRLLDEGKLTAGHAKTLLGVEPGERRRVLGVASAARGWSVRELEHVLTRLRAGTTLESIVGGKSGSGSGGKSGGVGADLGGVAGVLEAKPLSEREISIRDLEKRIGEHLGTKVRISTYGKGDRGTLRVEFYGLDHFDGLMERIGMSRESKG
ncbi:MAG: ParB/RepB/Spo0J family partition protein [Phycisphaeraceae bacterium]|nr:ParB/RepB/Spo0J family partition protein [Phycisphaeraceae bacterium]